MHFVDVRKRFDIWARDEDELERRLAGFRRAVWTRRGSVLDVERRLHPFSNELGVTVLYEIPIRTSPLEEEHEGVA